MATLTPLKADVTVNGGGLRWDRLAGAWGDAPAIGSFNLIDEPITAAVADGDTAIGLATGANTLDDGIFGLSDTDANFGTMSSLSIRYSSALVGTVNNDILGMGVRVLKSSDASVLVANDSAGNFFEILYYNSVSWSSTAGLPGAPRYDWTIAFNYINTTAPKSDWDGAEIQFRFVHTTSMGSDGTSVLLVDFELVGTYLLSSTPSVVSDRRFARTNHLIVR